MNKNILYITTSMFLILLTACGSASTDISAGSESITGTGSNIEETDSTTGINSDHENALPIQLQLLLGTFKLDETDYRLDSNQASDLLPLWKAARSLSESETVASVEIESVFNQIQELMSSEQIEAIAAMQFSQNDFAELAKTIGVEIGSGSRFDSMTPEEQATAQAMRESGQSPGGSGLPGQGGGPGRGLPGGETGGGAPNKGQGPRGATSGINSGFYDAIIEFLEAKIP